MRRLNSGGTCYHAVLKYVFLFPVKDLTIEIHKTNLACCIVWVWNLVSRSQRK